MNRLEQLPLLADLQATPRAGQKVGTKVTRAVAKKVARLTDLRLLRDWSFAVRNRDQWKDRKTGVRVHRSRQLDPLRAEAHHIEPRSDKAVRYDVRNGICLSFATHYAIETHQLRIEGTVFFKKHGATYIDGTYPVTFVRL